MGLQGAVVSCAMLEECCQWWLLDTKALCGPGFRSMGIDTCVGVKIPNLQKLISTYRTLLAARGPAVCSLRKPAWPPVVPFGRQRPSSPAPGGPAHGESQGQLSPAMDPHPRAPAARETQRAQTLNEYKVNTARTSLHGFASCHTYFTTTKTKSLNE